MSLHSIAILGFFLVGCMLPFKNPFYGTLAVLGFYFLNPPRHWWGVELAEITGPRWQFWLTACLLAGFVLHLDKYRSTVGRFRPVIGYLAVLVFAGVVSVLVAAARARSRSSPRSWPPARG